MQSIESNVSNFKVDAVFNRKPVKLLKKCMGIELVGVKHETHQEILSFLEFGNVFLSGAIEDRVRVIEARTD